MILRVTAIDRRWSDTVEKRDVRSVITVEVDDSSSFSHFAPQVLGYICANVTLFNDDRNPLENRPRWNRD